MPSAVSLAVTACFKAPMPVSQIGLVLCSSSTWVSVEHAMMLEPPMILERAAGTITAAAPRSHRQHPRQPPFCDCWQHTTERRRQPTAGSNMPSGPMPVHSRQATNAFPPRMRVDVSSRLSCSRLPQSSQVVVQSKPLRCGRGAFKLYPLALHVMFKCRTSSSMLRWRSGNSTMA